MNVKELTLKQKEKVNKINTLLTELRKDGVYPYVIDGGGGSGLTFIRSNKEDRAVIGDIILDGYNSEAFEEIDEKKYEAPKSYNNTIDYLVP